MKVLRLILSPDGHTHMKVILPDYGESGESPSVPLPYGGLDTSRATILKALNAPFNPKNFTGKDEQEWMVKHNLLDTNRRAFHPQLRENIGETLYQSLFPLGSMARELLGKMDYASKSGKSREQILIQLEIGANVGSQASLFEYPWELLYDGQFFLAKQGITIYRYIAYKNPPPSLSLVERINVLLVSSTACDLDHDLKPLPEEERQSIRKSLRDAEDKGFIHLDESKPATFDELRGYIQIHSGEDAPFIIHFDGHGHFGKLCNNVLSTDDEKECKTFHPGTRQTKCKACDAELPEPEGYLLFEDDSGGHDYKSASEIGSLLGLSNISNIGQGVAVVVLSACKSSLALTGDSVFNGVAQNLIANQIPAVVGMAFSIRIKAATAFANAFYLSLSQGQSLAMAMAWGRNSIGFKGNQWYRPVLYLRWKDSEGGQLFADLPVSKPQGLEIKGRKIVPIRQSLSTRVNIGKLPPVVSDLSGSQRKVNRLANAQKSLQVVIDETFNKEKLIWKSHCERVIDALKEIEKPISNLLKALSEPNSFPIQPSRAHKMRLENISAQVNSLCLSLGTFCTICPPSSTEVKGKQYDKEREDIRTGLIKLIDNIKIITTSLTLLFKTVE